MLIDFKDEDFDSKIKNEDVSVIQFSAAWCGPCKALKPVMDKLADEYKDKAGFYYADIEDGARVLNEYLQTLNCNKHVVVGMMANKDHEKYISYFKDISSLTTVDIPGQPNSIGGKDLKEKFKSISNVQYKESIEKAIKSIPLKKMIY